MLDPYLILGVSENATDETIHQAYLQGIRRRPADRDPEGFQSVRSAYELIRTRKARLEYALFTIETPSAADLLERLSPTRASKRPGIELFRDVLRNVEAPTKP